MTGLLVGTAPPAHADVGDITTVAGNGVPGYNADGIAATDAWLWFPSTVVADATGNLFIADFFNHRIRRVDAASGLIATVAGDGDSGDGGDGGPATDAQLNLPFGVAVDARGNIFISDSFNHRIRRVDADSGTIETIAGDGTIGFGGDGGPATSAWLHFPGPGAVDGTGNFFFPDQSNHRIRRVDAVSGIITTVAGDGTGSFGGDGGAATSAQLNRPLGVAIDGDGNLLIADLDNRRIRKVDAASGVIQTVAGSGDPGYGGDGGPATSAPIGMPAGPAIDAAGNLYIADFETHRIRRVDAITDVITTVAGNGTLGHQGDGGPATDAQLNWPTGVAVDTAGNLLIADQENHRVRRVEGIAAVIDADLDGVLDQQDNCVEVPNADQRDTDNDGFGNDCDADLNDDCIVNAQDLGLLRLVFFSTDPDADFNGDGGVNATDLGVMKTLFFKAPGPSGLPNPCDGV